jgi:hypothetical protein
MLLTSSYANYAAKRAHLENSPAHLLGGIGLVSSIEITELAAAQEASCAAEERAHLENSIARLEAALRHQEAQLGTQFTRFTRRFICPPKSTNADEAEGADS